MGDVVIIVLVIFFFLVIMLVSMKCVEENVGVFKKIINFIILLGVIINMDVSVVFEVVGVFFIV